MNNELELKIAELSRAKQLMNNNITNARNKTLVSIDDALKQYDVDQSKILFSQQDVKDAFSEYAEYLNQFILNKFTDECASTDKGTLLSDKILDVITKSKLKVDAICEKQKEEVDDFKTYKTHYSNMTYDEYKKLKK